MIEFLARISGLTGATPKEVATWLITNLGTKVAGTLALIQGTLYWIGPELPPRWEGFCRRGVIACGVYLLVTVAWRQSRNQKLMAKTIAVAANADAGVMQTSAAADPSVKRELKKIDAANEAIRSGSSPRPPDA